MARKPEGALEGDDQIARQHVDRAAHERRHRRGAALPEVEGNLAATIPEADHERGLVGVLGAAHPFGRVHVLPPKSSAPGSCGTCGVPSWPVATTSAAALYVSPDASLTLRPSSHRLPGPSAGGALRRRPLRRTGCARSCAPRRLRSSRRGLAPRQSPGSGRGTEVRQRAVAAVRVEVQPVVAVAPRRAGRRRALQHDDRHRGVEQPRRGGKPGRARADYHHKLIGALRIGNRAHARVAQRTGFCDAFVTNRTGRAVGAVARRQSLASCRLADGARGSSVDGHANCAMRAARSATATTDRNISATG